MVSSTASLEAQAGLGNTDAMCTLATLCDLTTIEGNNQTTMLYEKAAEAGCGLHIKEKHMFT